MCAAITFFNGQRPGCAATTCRKAQSARSTASACGSCVSVCDYSARSTTHSQRVPPQGRRRRDARRRARARLRRSTGPHPRLSCGYLARSVRGERSRRIRDALRRRQSHVVWLVEESAAAWVEQRLACASATTAARVDAAAAAAGRTAAKRKVATHVSRRRGHRGVEPSVAETRSRPTSAKRDRTVKSRLRGSVGGDAAPASASRKRFCESRSRASRGRCATSRVADVSGHLPRRHHAGCRASTRRRSLSASRGPRRRGGGARGGSGRGGLAAAGSTCRSPASSHPRSRCSSCTAASPPPAARLRGGLHAAAQAVLPRRRAGAARWARASSTTRTASSCGVRCGSPSSSRSVFCDSPRRSRSSSSPPTARRRAAEPARRHADPSAYALGRGMLNDPPINAGPSGHRDHRHDRRAAWRCASSRPAPRGVGKIVGGGAMLLLASTAQLAHWTKGWGAEGGAGRSRAGTSRAPPARARGPRDGQWRPPARRRSRGRRARRARRKLQERGDRVAICARRIRHAARAPATSSEGGVTEARLTLLGAPFLDAVAPRRRRR